MIFSNPLACCRARTESISALGEGQQYERDVLVEVEPAVVRRVAITPDVVKARQHRQKVAQAFDAADLLGVDLDGLFRRPCHDGADHDQERSKAQARNIMLL